MAKTTLKIRSPIIDTDGENFVVGDRVQLFDYFSSRYGDRWLLAHEGAVKPSATYRLGCDGMHSWTDKGIRVITRTYKNGSISVGKPINQ